MAHEVGLPGRNKEAVWRALQALFTLEVPFLVVRVLAAFCLYVPVSAMSIKNIVCVVYYMQVLVRYRVWKVQARVLRSPGAPCRVLVDALDGELLAIARRLGDRGSPLMAYERVGVALDLLIEPEEEFLEVYLEDLIGFPIAAASSAAFEGHMRNSAMSSMAGC